MVETHIYWCKDELQISDSGKYVSPSSSQNTPKLASADLSRDQRLNSHSQQHITSPLQVNPTLSSRCATVIYNPQKKMLQNTSPTEGFCIYGDETIGDAPLHCQLLTLATTLSQPFETSARGGSRKVCVISQTKCILRNTAVETLNIADVTPSPTLYMRIAMFLHVRKFPDCVMSQPPAPSPNTSAANSHRPACDLRTDWPLYSPSSH